ncbi:MAG: hypothetical protein AAF376_15250 [Pseudomonadota bacterium]
MMHQDATALLKAERHLRFHALRSGPDFAALTVEVDGAEVSDKTGPAGTGDPDVDRILGPVRSIETGPGCLRYSLVFDRCVAHAWRDESYAIPEPDEDFSTMLRHYDRSAFLDHVARTTFAADAAGFLLQHHAIVTLDAIVDVICAAAPQVTTRMLGPDDPGPPPGRPREHGQP